MPINLVQIKYILLCIASKNKNNILIKLYNGI